ncbi:maltose ABC transporter substrate-binding protein [Salinibacterium sp. NSLL150]|uniref:sugar ABC transporter substrate-binding protein n=1 Tax=unclassified Salinibacterium TaxID=2632331 RepID=UPI0018CF0359|nr:MULTISPECIES: maltose ABC transporter substrate-binding protein [unclassified Salinibacterium]MBH0099902.1 maltose ABC transporter substrate-binding protein [Salinibacterium sp. NSLL35]MBH0102656.1 maltose ABC transporter substrate-binding protein [Salinibacterium sp. NSLL150]MBH0105416.1 maltose ABC transporter substrate-binding protein [Salinibacterium sp. NSLL16]MBH0108176.1 maltose ABC transporter substrate-binding protein [Salinibacterium sp. NSLL17]
MRVNNKGLWAVGALTVTASLVLTGCTAASDTADNSAGTGEALTVWVDADRAAVLKDAAADFTAETGVEVKLVQKEFGDIRDQFIAQVPTGKGPDVVIGAHDWLGTFVTNGVVAPVELGDKADAFQDVGITAMSYEGQVYGVPYSIENIALVRNTALAPSTPATFDEMVTMGEAAGTEYPFLVGLDPEAADPYHLYPFQTSFGAPVFGTAADGSYDADALEIGNDGGDKFAAWLGEQGAAGVLNTNITGDLAKEKFIAGESPFYLTGPWNVPAAVEAGIDVAIDPIPSAGGETAQPFVGVQGFFVSSKSENALAANEFIVNYMGSEEVQTALFEVGGRAPALTASFEAASADPIVAGFGAVGENAVPMPSIPAMGAVWEFWGVTEAAIINGGDATSLWQKMSGDIETAIAG